MEETSRAELKSPGQRRGDGEGRGFHSEMAREGALAHLPSQYGRRSRPSSVAWPRSSLERAEMTQAREADHRPLPATRRAASACTEWNVPPWSTSKTQSIPQEASS